MKELTLNELMAAMFTQDAADEIVASYDAIMPDVPRPTIDAIVKISFALMSAILPEAIKAGGLDGAERALTELDRMAEGKFHG